MIFCWMQCVMRYDYDGGYDSCCGLLMPRADLDVPQGRIVLE